MENCKKFFLILQTNDFLRRVAAAIGNNKGLHIGLFYRNSGESAFEPEQARTEE